MTEKLPNPGSRWVPAHQCIATASRMVLTACSASRCVELGQSGRPALQRGRIGSWAVRCRDEKGTGAQEACAPPHRRGGLCDGAGVGITCRSRRPAWRSRAPTGGAGVFPGRLGRQVPWRLAGRSMSFCLIDSWMLRVLRSTFTTTAVTSSPSFSTLRASSTRSREISGAQVAHDVFAQVDFGATGVHGLDLAGHGFGPCRSPSRRW